MMSYLSLGGGSDDPAGFTPIKAAPALGNSNLSALFGLNDQMNNNPNSNQALTYTAPKPPGKAVSKQQQQANSGSAASGVACAVAVTAYRFVNGQNVKQGKLGAAILRNVAEKDYKILMYVTKQQPVSTTQINPAFQFTVQANNYASFNDDLNQTWTVLFANTAQLHDFAKQICLAKFFTSPQASSGNAIQDLSQSDNQNAAVETGDSLEMKYSGWLVNANGSLGNMFDSNHNSEKTFRFKTGRGKVIKGWETGMIGMRSGGKRFLVIPPHLAYGQKAVGNRVPPDSTLAFEVDLLRVKQSKDSSSMKSAESIEAIPQAVPTEQNPPPNPAVLSTVQAPISTENSSEPVRGRTASLRDQLANTSNDTSKAAIASRMARMGQAMLPISPQADGPPMFEKAQVNMMPGNEQSETVSPNISQPISRSSTPGYNQPQQPLMPMQQHAPQLAPGYNQGQQASHFQPPPTGQPTQQQMHPYQQQQQFQPPLQSYSSPQHHQNLLQNQMQPPQALQTYVDHPTMSSHPNTDQASMYHPAYRQSPQYPQPQGYGSELMPVLVSETRQQSAEVRLLQEKVDKVSGMVEEVKKITEETQTNQPKLSPSQTLDAGVIMLNVQRIMKENEQLKQTVSDKNKQIEQQNEKISDLLQQNQKYVEKSNLMLEQRNDTFKESFTQNQARSLQLAQDKVGLTERLSDATSKVSELTLEITNLKQKESDLKQKFKEIYMKEKERAEEAEEKIKELEEKLNLNEETLQTVTSSGANAKSEVDGLRREITSLKESRASDKQTYIESLTQSTNEKVALQQRLNELQSNFEEKLTEIQRGKESASVQNKQQSDEVLNLRERLTAMATRLNETQENLNTSEEKISLFQQRFGQMRAAYEEQKNKLQEAMSEVEETSQYKEAYDRLRLQASSMKEKYEKKILEMKEELESKEEGGGDGRANVVEEVKKIMNIIFQRARNLIGVQEHYAGADVLKILLEIIKKTTLSLLKNEAEQEDDSASEEEQDETVDTPVKVAVEEKQETSPENDESLKEDVNDKEEDETEPDLMESSSDDEKQAGDNLSQKSATDDEEPAPASQISTVEQEEDDHLNDEEHSKDVEDPVTSQTSMESNKEPQKSEDDKSTLEDKEEECEPEFTENVSESETKEESAGDFVVIAKIEDKSKDDDAEAAEKDANEPKEKASEITDEQSLDAPLTKPARNISSESLASISDDRKPPPLFDEESDDGDLNWLN